MLGVLFASIGSFVGEISASIIKFSADHQRGRMLTTAFINSLAGGVVIGTIGLVRGNFIFSPASFPTFAVRAVFEIFQMHLTLAAIQRAERSTQSFLHSLSIPLLLIADLFLGYTVTPLQIAGIVLVLVTIGFLVAENTGHRQGTVVAVLASLNAVVTISLYKYNITRFNSVEAEQTLMYGFLLCYFFFVSLVFARTNPIAVAWKEKMFLAQGGAQAVGSAFQSFAILFGSASVIIAAKRASGVLAGVIAGKRYFKEEQVFMKILLGVLLIAGLVLLMR